MELNILHFLLLNIKFVFRQPNRIFMPTRQDAELVCYILSDTKSIFLLICAWSIENVNILLSVRHLQCHDCIIFFTAMVLFYLSCPFEVIFPQHSLFCIC